MNINLNGTSYKTNHTKIIDLLKELELDYNYLIVCVNNNVFKSNEIQKIELKENDVVDLISIVEGG